MSDILPIKYKIFCLEYTNSLNAAEAADKSGLRMKPDAILARPEVQEELSHLITQRCRALNLNADAILLRLLDNATAATACKDFASANGAYKLAMEYMGMIGKAAKIVVQNNQTNVGFNFGRTHRDEEVYNTEGTDIPEDEPTAIECEADATDLDSRRALPAAGSSVPFAFGTLAGAEADAGPIGAAAPFQFAPATE
jgi:hypothetical protein